ncbi:hypothetical protein AAF712_014460 [Marasmius tenuissimus]|uniref:Uncharacterized protein n=1 Tax=Marasmius tenuissimus TaxID=585030 RepID=A0ABR2ZDI5_9AGAR
MKHYGTREVAPVLRMDLSKTENVTITSFILAIINDLYPNSNPSSILVQILDFTFKIANGEIPPFEAEAKAVMEKQIPLIFSNFCGDTTKEDDRHAVFVSACNAALFVLAKVKVDGDLDFPVNDMYLLRHNPTEIKGTRRLGEENMCKPAVINASLAVVKKIFKEERIALPGVKNLHEWAPEPTQKAIPWQHIFSSVEFKSMQKGLLSQLQALMARQYTATTMQGDGQPPPSIDELKQTFDRFHVLASCGGGRSRDEPSANTSSQSGASN